MEQNRCQTCEYHKEELVKTKKLLAQEELYHSLTKTHVESMQRLMKELYMEIKALKEIQGVRAVQDSASVKDAYFDVLDSVRRDLEEKAKREMSARPALPQFTPVQQVYTQFAPVYAPVQQAHPSHTSVQQAPVQARYPPVQQAHPSHTSVQQAPVQQAHPSHASVQMQAPVQSNNWQQAQSMDDNPYAREDTFVNNTRRRERFDLGKVVDMTSDFKIEGKMVPASSLQLNSIFIGRRMPYYLWCKRTNCGKECTYAHLKM